MHIGLLDVDSHNFPNFALMKASAYHKKEGDRVEWVTPLGEYDIVYASKIFTFSPEPDFSSFFASSILLGGSGYDLRLALPPRNRQQYFYRLFDI